MKIQCDVCEKEEASVFCSADEAALCGHCDRRVHHANKLAGKHHRLSLVHPSFKDSPPCDICQDRRGFMFCQEDRAILCRECDTSIHRANEHTLKHNRFLLPGVKLSPTADPSSSSYQTSNEYSIYKTADSSESQTDFNKNSVSEEIGRPISVDHEAMESTSTACKNEDYNCMSQEYAGSASVSTSSTSEYLMQTLPGWHIEDFLDPSCFNL